MARCWRRPPPKLRRRNSKPRPSLPQARASLSQLGGAPCAQPGPQDRAVPQAAGAAVPRLAKDEQARNRRVPAQALRHARHQGAHRQLRRQGEARPARSDQEANTPTPARPSTNRARPPSPPASVEGQLVRDRTDRLSRRKKTAAYKKAFVYLAGALGRASPPLFSRTPAPPRTRASLGPPPRARAAPTRNVSHCLGSRQLSNTPSLRLPRLAARTSRRAGGAAAALSRGRGAADARGARVVARQAWAERARAERAGGASRARGVRPGESLRLAGSVGGPCRPWEDEELSFV